MALPSNALLPANAAMRQSTARAPAHDGTNAPPLPRHESVPPTQSSRGRVDPALMASLPPEFVALLGEYGQLMDIDGDGTPDIAVVPLNAMAAGMSGVGGPPAVTPALPGQRFPKGIVPGGV